MLYVKRIIDFILYSNIFIAFGAFLLSISTFIEQKTPIHFSYCVFVFFATLFIYNYQRVFYKKQINDIENSQRRTWISNNQFIIRSMALIGLFGTIVLVFFIPSRLILYLSPLFVLSLAYFFPSFALRRFIGTKTFILVLVWTVTTYMIPMLLNESFVFSSSKALYLLSGFSFMAAICIPFDNRDVKIDSKENIKTFAVLLGRKKNSKIALLFSFVYLLMISFLYFSEDLKLSLYICNIFLFLLTVFFIIKDDEKKSEYFYIAGIDGLLIIKGGMLLLLEAYAH